MGMHVAGHSVSRTPLLSSHTQEKNAKDKPKLSHTRAMLRNLKVRSFHLTTSFHRRKQGGPERPGKVLGSS